jgi:sugar phosphate isomerase/epimerase
MDTLKRRDFIRLTGFTAAGLAATPAFSAGPLNLSGGGDSSWSFNFFSKHLQFLDYDEAAEACVLAGMDGSDLTVRPGGHVLPENVERDLPLAVKAFEKAGLKVEMMASGITDAEDPLSEKVLQVASELGIKYYRLGYYKYDPALTMGKNLERIKVKMEGLARLNEKYRIHGAYQNHAGSNFGAPVWDLWTVIRDMDPRWTGCQYDICHATAEGNRSWPLGLKALKDHIRCIVVKDFRWGERDGKAREIYLPVGEGVVDFQSYFGLLKELGIQVPITFHLEYPLGPEKEMSLAREKELTIDWMRKDLAALKSYL